MADKRESGRVKELQQRRILDEPARRRRQRKALEALEQDNFQDDPHADLKMSKKAPKFEESIEIGNIGQISSAKKKKKNRTEYFKYRLKKSFAALIEEEQLLSTDPPNYFSASTPPSKFPERHFCAVCGFPSSYICVSCGSRYCSVKCLGTHQDTRCLKWTA
ncbi:hypothetical protein CHS0354_021436 [Potamilus streckersoni]|uniref:HIT-type domain-containing protein n=1 Tax=Potamilus streckersoni TaxID=2493646 RepID=A0AAE0S247_9BIVA|nr:hypothetical protein CHS0354_021436 [Potamilus streckersoni]